MSMESAQEIVNLSARALTEPFEPAVGIVAEAVVVVAQLVSDVETELVSATLTVRTNTVEVTVVVANVEPVLETPVSVKTQRLPSLNNVPFDVGSELPSKSEKKEPKDWLAKLVLFKSQVLKVFQPPTSNGDNPPLFSMSVLVNLETTGLLLCVQAMKMTLKTMKSQKTDKLWSSMLS